MDVSSPRVEVSCIGVPVLRVCDAMCVEYELVWREVETAIATLDAFSSGAVVAGRNKVSSATPRALMVDIEREVVGQLRRSSLEEKRFAQSFGLTFGDHSAATRANRHGSCPT